jgi:hypothetical protein
MMAFSEHRIKYELREKTGKTLSALGVEWGYRFQEMSMCVRRQEGRIYPALRLLIAEKIGYHVNTVFGAHPLTTQLLSKSKDKRSKAA